MGEIEHEDWQPGVGAVLEIGDDIGALVLYTEADFEGREIEISLVGDDRRVHTQIHARRMGDSTVYAGVYPNLRAGSYQVWTDQPDLADRVTIEGGRATELDWRSSGARPDDEGRRRAAQDGHEHGHEHGHGHDHAGEHPHDHAPDPAD